MGQNSLVTDEIVAGSEFLHRFNQYMPVKAAFWLQAADSDQPYLYVASDELSDQNFDIAYGEVLRITKEIRSTSYLDPFCVRLIYADNPLAQAAVQIEQDYPAPLNTRFRGSEFGGVSVDDVYIYSPKSFTSQP
ncbi:hypothetical protein [Blastopirellula marina]|uniref:Uncharacterized protein n=1 Tax=Blastopirellula marina TaxID=124 RepID=A0A2S8GG03_9BACT|nr:hypothetical protein [Blastopirellula marina]PQO43407.1 hypothetical protein C5Y98_00400 [Blastopirellula marina]PTL46721.1 hypothetical protein C5Y97_00400 [Blastopirellula marina]